MRILPKKIIIALFCITFLSISNLCAQSDKAKINQLINQKKEFNKNNKNSIIYKIQLYNGNESQAYKVKANFQTVFPNYKTDIIYKAPDWKTQVVYFKTKLEADRALLKIKEKNSSAIVLRDKI